MQSLLPSKFTGIIQVTPADETQLLELQQAVLEQFPDQQPNPKLHVTPVSYTHLTLPTNA